MLKVTKTVANRSSFQYTFGRYMVQVYRVLGTKSWVMRVYEETPSYMAGMHTSLATHVETGKLYGACTSAKFDCALPVGAERSETFDNHHTKLCAQSYGILFGLFPSLMQDSTLHFDDGDVELHGETFNHEPVEFYKPSTEWPEFYRLRREAYRDQYLKDDAKLSSWFDDETLFNTTLFTDLGHVIS